MLETIVAIVIATAAISAAAQIVALSATQQRLAERQAWATEQAANAMERLYATPWDELTQERAGQFRLPPEVEQTLTDGELLVQVETSGDSPPAKIIRVQVGWRSSQESTRRTVHLSAWKKASKAWFTSAK